MTVMVVNRISGWMAVMMMVRYNTVSQQDDLCQEQHKNSDAFLCHTVLSYSFL
jgi:hypothetical protein